MDKVLEELQELRKLIIEQNLIQKQVLNLNEAASFLELSHSHLYKLTSTHAIPHYKPNGKKLYFNRQELADWLMQNRIESDTRTDQLATNYVIKNKR